jgi:hypothetical protein
MSSSPRMAFQAAILPAGLLWLLLAPSPSFAVGDNDFSGTWTAWVCPKGEASGPPNPARCSSFVLSLYQKENKLCGSHLFATAGATQLDEGGAPSLVASIENGAAHGTIESRRGAAPVQLHFDLKVSDNVLTWQRLDSPEGEYMLPRSARLRRSVKGNLFGPVFVQRLSAVCASTLAMVTTAVPTAVPTAIPPAGQDAAGRAGARAPTDAAGAPVEAK